MRPYIPLGDQCSALLGPFVYVTLSFLASWGWKGEGKARATLRRGAPSFPFKDDPETYGDRCLRGRLHGRPLFERVRMKFRSPALPAVFVPERGELALRPLFGIYRNNRIRSFAKRWSAKQEEDKKKKSLRPPIFGRIAVRSACWVLAARTEWTTKWPSARNSTNFNRLSAGRGRRNTRLKLPGGRSNVGLMHSENKLICATLLQQLFSNSK